MSGYVHRDYAASLAALGTPFRLPGCGGWILQRTIPGSRRLDAMGCYPMFACPDWSRLPEDVRSLEHDLVSLALVTDPFGASPDILRCAFPDLVVAVKEHYVIDLRRPIGDGVSRHHRSHARRALARVRVEVEVPSAAFLDTWTELYATLVRRHSIRGPRRFEPATLAAQLAVPGAFVVCARYEDGVVGAQIWMLHSRVAYGHVLAFSPLGYRVGAPYALYWAAFEHLARRVDWCDIGGVSSGPGAEGLLRFKRGWTDTTRPSYFCGRVFDRAAYASLAARRNTGGSDYFPAYRFDEFSGARLPAGASPQDDGDSRDGTSDSARA